MNLTCINCPLGCDLKVDINEANVETLTVTGNHCEKGRLYAQTEALHPVRVVTTTVRVEGEAETLPVKTKEPIPKEKVFACVRELRNVVVRPPVKIGDTIVSDIAHTGVDIVATKNWAIDFEKNLLYNGITEFR